MKYPRKIITFLHGVAKVKDTPKNERILENISVLEKRVQDLKEDIEILWKKVKFE